MSTVGYHYDKAITGQHTQTMEQEELHKIEEVTGKQPAVTKDRLPELY